MKTLGIIDPDISILTKLSMHELASDHCFIMKIQDRFLCDNGEHYLYNDIQVFNDEYR